MAHGVTKWSCINEILFTEKPVVLMTHCHMCHIYCHGCHMCHI